MTRKRRKRSGTIKKHQGERGMVKLCLLIVFIFAFTGCSRGWSIAGYELSPSDTTHIEINIVDQDSTWHTFRQPVVLNYDNWCYRHNIYEVVETKDGK